MPLLGPAHVMAERAAYYEIKAERQKDDMENGGKPKSLMPKTMIG